MRLSAEQCRERMAVARVARLATAGTDLRPHIVPVTFAIAGERLVTAVDQKPKVTTRLRRLRNIEENPNVAVLVDHYDDDWTQLWWVRADGRAAILDDEADREQAAELLAQKYVQYSDDPPRGPVVTVDVGGWSGWAYAPAATRAR